MHAALLHPRAGGGVLPNQGVTEDPEVAALCVGGNCVCVLFGGRGLMMWL